MTFTKNSRGRKNQPARRVPAEYQVSAPTPDRGVTLMLQNPEPLFADFNDRAAAFEAACKQASDKASDLLAEGKVHQQREGEAAAEEMRLQQQLNELAKQRDSHSKQKDGKFADARHYEEQAKGFEIRAADLRASIATLQEAHRNGQQTPATAPNGNGQTPVTVPIPAQPAVDPTADDPRMAGPMSRFNEAHDQQAEAGAA